MVLDREGERTLDVFRWGLVPSWAEDIRIGNSLINARAETLSTKRAFRSAFQHRHCVIPADGFYEWDRPEESKGKGKGQPYWFWRADGDICAFAGIWEAWKDAGGQWLLSAAIVTTAASSDMQGVHDRMPVVLGEGDWQEWLSARSHNTGALGSLLAPADPGTLLRRPVSRDVNRPANDGPSLIEELREGHADGQFRWPAARS